MSIDSSGCLLLHMEACKAHIMALRIASRRATAAGHLTPRLTVVEKKGRQRNASAVAVPTSSDPTKSQHDISVYLVQAYV